MTTAKYLKEAGKILAKVKPLAIEYYLKTGRPLGVAGEMAEYEAIRILNLEVAPVRQSGYDAIRKIKNKEYKIQIKGRSVQERSKGQKLGSISLKKEWDFIVLVLFDGKMNPTVIHEATRKKVEKVLTEPGSKARNERGQLNVSKFIEISVPIWEAKFN